MPSDASDNPNHRLAERRKRAHENEPAGLINEIIRRLWTN